MAITEIGNRIIFNKLATIVPDPLMVGANTYSVASGDQSVGGAVAGTAAGTLGWRIGQQASRRLLGKLPGGRVAGTLLSIFGAGMAADAGSRAGNTYAPVWRRASAPGMAPNDRYQAELDRLQRRLQQQPAPAPITQQ